MPTPVTYTDLRRDAFKKMFPSTYRMFKSIVSHKRRAPKLMGLSNIISDTASDVEDTVTRGWKTFRANCDKRGVIFMILLGTFALGTTAAGTIAFAPTGTDVKGGAWLKHTGANVLPNSHSASYTDGYNQMTHPDDPTGHTQHTGIVWRSVSDQELEFLGQIYIDAGVYVTVSSLSTLFDEESVSSPLFFKKKLLILLLSGTVEPAARSHSPGQCRRSDCPLADWICPWSTVSDPKGIPLDCGSSQRCGWN